jgi:ElaA protein
VSASGRARRSPVSSNDNVGEVVAGNPTIQRRRFSELSPLELHDLVKLRVDVFVVEQGCPYSDLDGRDIEPDAEHCWIDIDGTVATYLRVLRDPDGYWRIGRVVTNPNLRGRDLAATLMTEILATIGRPVRIHAQAHLAGWYRQFGFEVSGPEFDEDGIAHLPMVIA